MDRSEKIKWDAKKFADRKEREGREIKYVGLGQFLKTYREKLLITTNKHAPVELEAFSMDHIKKQA
jgi:hypothetical protein